MIGIGKSAFLAPLCSSPLTLPLSSRAGDLFIDFGYASRFYTGPMLSEANPLYLAAVQKVAKLCEKYEVSPDLPYWFLALSPLPSLPPALTPSFLRRSASSPDSPPHPSLPSRRRGDPKAQPRRTSHLSLPLLSALSYPTNHPLPSARYSAPSSSSLVLMVSFMLVH